MHISIVTSKRNFNYPVHPRIKFLPVQTRADSIRKYYLFEITPFSRREILESGNNAMNSMGNFISITTKKKN